MIRVEGASVEDAFARANHLMLANRWGDGLPLWPPTRERVDWILTGAAQPRRQRLGTFPPRGGVTTIESCAIALAMAGGRPEYLPVLVAAVEAFLDPESGSETLQAASGSAFPVVIVNGPIGAQIRLNAGFGCLGPDPQRPAGASIGRALRLLQQNLGGALPGIGTMANYGGLRYTNVVFAEDEASLPAGWAPHAHRAPRLRAGRQFHLARLRQRGHEHPAARRQEGDARGGRAPGHAPHGRLHARAQHGRPRRLRARHPGHPDDPGHRRPDHGRPRLDQGLDARVPLGALAHSRRAAPSRGGPGVDRDRHEQGGAREPRAGPVADHGQPRQLPDRRGRRRPPDQQLLAPGLQPRRRRARDRGAAGLRRACWPTPSATSALASGSLSRSPPARSSTTCPSPGTSSSRW